MFDLASQDEAQHDVVPSNSEPAKGRSSHQANLRLGRDRIVRATLAESALESGVDSQSLWRCLSQMRLDRGYLARVSLALLGELPRAHRTSPRFRLGYAHIARVLPSEQYISEPQAGQLVSA